jgi:hypothetical protein
MKSLLWTYIEGIMVMLTLWMLIIGFGPGDKGGNG